MDDNILEKYESRLIEKKESLDSVNRQLEVLVKAKEKREQDYNDEIIRQEKFKELYNERKSVASKLENYQHGTADWYSVYADLEKIDKNINKALRGWKVFW